MCKVSSSARFQASVMLTLAAQGDLTSARYFGGNSAICAVCTPLLLSARTQSTIAPAGELPSRCALNTGICSDQNHS